MKNKWAYTITRILLGLGFIFYGVVKFIPMDAPALPQPAADFLTSMAATGYFIPFLGIVEILIGVLLVANFWVPFAMVILSPVMLNIILFNMFLAPSATGFIMLLVLLILQVYIMYCTWHTYKPLFVKRMKI